MPITPSLVAELKPLVEGHDADEPVRTTGRGAPLRPRNRRHREFNAARTAAERDGIGRTPHRPPHRPRHTAASLAIAFRISFLESKRR